MSVFDNERLLAGESQMAISIPGRLHLGFVDLHGGMGRRFGSIGLGLDWPRLKITARRADTLTVSGLHGERASRVLQHLAERIDLAPTEVLIEGDAPLHQGLGVGTQLSLAACVAVCRLHNLDMTPREILGLLDRGAQSGIGLALFEHGGLVVDGGRGTTGAPPPLISRIEFPDTWRVVLVMDKTPHPRLVGKEQECFRKLPPFSPALADRLCRELLMRALPALAEQDLENFGRAIGEIQRCVGDYFSPIQGGRYVSPSVAAVLERFESLGAMCIGQSGWGPTGFAIVDSQTFAHLLVRDAREVFGKHLGALHLQVVCGRNHGAQVSASWQPKVVPHSTQAP